MMHKSGRTDTQTPGSSNQERYLRDYIEQVQAGLLPAPTAPSAKKKLTFEEWWKDQDHYVYGGERAFEYHIDAAEAAWKAAQENM